MGAEGIHIDLGELGTELKKVDRVLATAVRKNVRTAVNESGAAILSTAKGNAGWSSRIPGATKLTVSFSAKRSGVTIRTARGRAPHARAYEQTGGAPSFRHKVFGRDDWVTQTARPFLFPAVASRDAGTTASIQEAINKAVREAGFH